MKKYLLMLFMCLLLTGCGSKTEIDFKTITSEEAKIELDKDNSIIILDVRTLTEYEGNHIKGSINIPLNDLESKIIEVVPDKNAKIFVYCQAGTRSKSASQILVDLGYKNVFDMGGINSWPYETE